MSIPRNGKVVIVDDRLKEALPLIKALSQEGISYSYFSGNPTELPPVPLQGVRLLFLDLRLEGVPETFDEDDIKNTIKPVVEKIVSPDNGPYIIFGWTNNPDQLEAVVNNLDFKPILYLNMDKSDCLRSPQPLALINKKLRNKISTLGKIGLLFKWENFVNQSSQITTNSLYEIVGGTLSLENTLYKMSEAYLGKHIDEARPLEKKRALFQSLNRLLLDTTQRTILNLDLHKYGDLVLSEKPEQECLYKLNAKYLLNSHPIDLVLPGNIYLSNSREINSICRGLIEERIDKNKIKNILNRELSKEDGWNRLTKEDRTARVDSQVGNREIVVKNEIKKIFVEITPICDYSQNVVKCHRVLCGLLYPIRIKEYFNENKIEGSYYASKAFYWERYYEPYEMLFNYRGLITIPKSKLQRNRPILNLNQESLFDIQHKTGAHISRPGIITVI